MTVRTGIPYVEQGGDLTLAGYQALRLVDQRMTSPSAVAGSGATIDFTDIPSWARRITVTGQGVSTNGTNRILLRIGDGAIIATGYLGALSTMTATVATVAFTNSCGLTDTIAATSVYRFKCDIFNTSGNIWVFSGSGAFSDVAATTNFASELTLSGKLDRVRVLIAGGVDNFDAGSFNIAWE